MKALVLYDCSWAQGYDGGRADYIARDVICFKCGNNIKFIKPDESVEMLTAPGDGVGPFAVHPVNKVLAFSGLSINPKIYVYAYPSLALVHELEGKETILFSTPTHNN